MRHAAILKSIVAIGLLTVGNVTPARAVLLGPEADVPSAVAYLSCLAKAPTKKEAAKCALILLDPPSNEVVSIDLTLTYDPTRVSILADPRFFGVFSDSGVEVPLVSPTIGGVQPLLPLPGIDLDDTKVPRSGSLVTFTADNVLGIAHLSWDLSANPTPSGAPPQNFFGYQLTSLVGPITGIEYFDTPGNYDVMVSSWSCKLADQQSCGSSTPVMGFTITTGPEVPEPASWAMMTAGFGWVGSALRTRRKVAAQSA
jgi:hypothetical protein